MSGVTPIRNVRHDPSQKWPIIISILGLLMLFIGKDAIIMGLILIAIGIIWWKLNKPAYAVGLTNASGETEALSSKDGEYIKGIVKALNDAIVSRG